MDAILTVLKSIDFWTIVGAIGSVVAAMFAVFALTRFNRKSKAQERADELKAKAQSIESLVNELIASYNSEGAAWERHARAQPSTWKSTVPEFEKYLTGTMSLHAQVARALDVLFQQPELSKPRCQDLESASKALAAAVDDTMTFRQVTDVPLKEAVQGFQRARLRL